jgi:hypothetical protein
MAGLLRRQGFAVKVEKGLGKGRSADLEARREGKKIAIEVETGKSDAIYNIRKDLEAGYDRILAVCLEEGLRERIKSQIKEIDLSGKERVIVKNLKEALNTTNMNDLMA